MMRLRRAAALAVIMTAALASSACIEPQTFGTLKGVVNARSLLQEPMVETLAQASARYMPAWIGAATVVALLALYLRLKNGDSSMLAPSLTAFVLAYTLAVPTQRDALFWPRQAVRLADRVANLYPVTDWLNYGQTGPLPDASPGGFARLVWRAAGTLRERLEQLGGDRTSVEYSEAEAVGTFLATPIGALLITLATAGSYISSLALQIIQAMLVALLSVLLPVMIPFAVMPWTRGVFWGFLRWYFALLLWAPMFRIVDALLLAVHVQVLTAPLRAALDADSTWTLAQVLPNSLAAGLVVHLAFFALQFMVPGVAHAIVHGVAQRSIR